VSPSEASEKLAASLQSPLHSPVQSLLHSRDNKAVAIRTDLSSSSAAADLAARAVQVSKDLGTGGKIDSIILCAGIMPMATLDKIDEKTWNEVFAVNVVGPVFLAKVRKFRASRNTRRLMEISGTGAPHSKRWTYRLLLNIVDNG